MVISKRLGLNDIGSPTQVGGNDWDEYYDYHNGINLPGKSATITTPTVQQNHEISLGLNSVIATGITNGDLVKANNGKYIRWAKGSALQVPRVTSDGLDMEWYTPSAGGSGGGGGFEAGGSLSFSGNASTKIFNIPHGLGTTPAIYFANAKSVDALGAYTTTVTSTNVVVTYSVAPPQGSDNLTFVWGAASVTVGPGVLPLPATYTIYKSGANYISKSGITSNIISSNTDAATVINATIAAAVHGDLIYFMGNTVYTINSTVTVNKGITLKGNGLKGDNNSTFANNFNGTMIHITSGSARVEGITFIGTDNAANTLDVGLKISGSNNVYIDNCYFLKHYDDIMFTGIVFYSQISNCTWYSAKRSLIRTDATTDLNLQVFHCMSAIAECGGDAFYIEGADGMTFIGVEMSGVFSGSILTLDRWLGGITLIDTCAFENSVTHNNCIWLKGSSGTPIYGTFIQNSWLAGGNVGLTSWAIRADYTTSLHVKNCYILGIGRGIQFNNANIRTELVGNHFEAFQSSSIVANTTSSFVDFIFLNNYFNTASSFVINFSPIAAGVITGLNRIEGNHVRLGAAPQISLPAGAPIVVRNNPGWKTEAEGATSVADGGTITHGLAAQPTVVTVQATIASEFASVTALSPTTFTVALKKHDNGVGTTQAVHWRATVLL